MSLSSFFKLIIVGIFIYGFFFFACEAVKSYEKAKYLAVSNAINSGKIYALQTYESQSIIEILKAKDLELAKKINDNFFYNLKKFHSKDSLQHSMISFKIYDNQYKLILSDTKTKYDFTNSKFYKPSYYAPDDTSKNAAFFKQNAILEFLSKFALINQKVEGFKVAKIGMVFGQIIKNAIDENGEKKHLIQVFMPIDDEQHGGVVLEYIYDFSSDFEQMRKVQYISVFVFLTIFLLMALINSYNNKASNKIIESQHEMNRKISEAKDAIERESREKSEFLANFTHELRTPLNAIIGFSEIIKNETHGEIENKQYVEHASDIYASGAHLLALINDILDYSKAAANRLSVNREEMDLNRVISASLKLVEPRAQEAKVNLVKQLPQEHIILVADQKRLKQVMLNLLSNAVKFTPEEGSVTVKLSENEQEILIEVQDTGIGMKEKDISKALSSFGQLDSKHSRKYEGTGLGLPLTKKLVELMGGDFKIRSQEGMGTYVRVLFLKKNLKN